MKPTAVSVFMVLLLLGAGPGICSHTHVLETAVVPRDTGTSAPLAPETPAETARPTPAATLPPPTPSAGAEPTSTLAPRLPACCKPAPAGLGWLWFDNHVEEIVSADVGLKTHEIPAKQGDVAGCLCQPFDPGRYTVILHTGTHEVRLDVDVVAGEVRPFVVYPEGH